MNKNKTFAGGQSGAPHCGAAEPACSLYSRRCMANAHTCAALIGEQQPWLRMCIDLGHFYSSSADLRLSVEKTVRSGTWQRCVACKARALNAKLVPPVLLITVPHAQRSLIHDLQSIKQICRLSRLCLQYHCSGYHTPTFRPCVKHQDQSLSSTASTRPGPPHNHLLKFVYQPRLHMCASVYSCLKAQWNCRLQSSGPQLNLQLV